MTGGVAPPVEIERDIRYIETEADTIATLTPTHWQFSVLRRNTRTLQNRHMVNPPRMKSVWRGTGISEDGSKAYQIRNGKAKLYAEAPLGEQLIDVGFLLRSGKVMEYDRHSERWESLEKLDGIMFANLPESSLYGHQVEQPAVIQRDGSVATRDGTILSFGDPMDSHPIRVTAKRARQWPRMIDANGESGSMYAFTNQIAARHRKYDFAQVPSPIRVVWGNTPDELLVLSANGQVHVYDFGGSVYRGLAILPLCSDLFQVGGCFGYVTMIADT